MTIQDLSELTAKRRVVVTGGAGAIGREVLKELHQHKNWYEVTVVDRNTPEVLRRLKPFRKDFRFVLGNVYDPALIEKAVTGADVVIHLAAVIPPLADHRPELAEKVNTGGTRILVKTLEEKAPGAFLLYTSSVSVYGDRVYNPWITVDDPLLPSEGDFYAETKIRAEKIVRTSRLKWSIFRLSAIMDPVSKLDPLFFHMPLNTSLEIATTRDAGFALVEAMYHIDKIKGKTFNLSGGSECRTTYRNFLDSAFKAKGLKHLDLPEEAFAQKNFHCGYFMDSDQLDEILHFQRDTLDTYFEMMQKQENWWNRRVFKIFHKQIKGLLVKRSEPLKALKSGKRSKIHHFYYSEA
jgi:nucleoside-diphosphate-sugar epimerase